MPIEQVTVKHNCGAITTALIGYSLCSCGTSLHTYRDSSGLHVSAGRGMVSIVYRDERKREAVQHGK